MKETDESYGLLDKRNIANFLNGGSFALMFIMGMFGFRINLLFGTIVFLLMISIIASYVEHKILSLESRSRLFLNLVFFVLMIILFTFIYPKELMLFFNF
ncbi:hypothetical protein KKC45_03070 [Patescibacteria group bacterium]|nr:hypothetical protein [Patescibacteria group bacterium]